MNRFQFKNINTQMETRAYIGSIIYANKVIRTRISHKQTHTPYFKFYMVWHCVYFKIIIETIRRYFVFVSKLK